MKVTKLANLLLLGLFLTITAVGCKKHPYGPTPIPKGQNGGLMGNANPGGLETLPPVTAPEAPAGTNDPFARNGNGTIPTSTTDTSGWPQNREQFKADTAYFDFDSSVVKSSEASKLQDVASFLKSNQSDALLIEGHCDERGTEEYNRSLGERRALALREYLAKLGVNPESIRTVSYGFDRAAVPGHSEAAWSKNRRGEFVLLTPKP